MKKKNVSAAMPVRGGPTAVVGKEVLPREQGVQKVWVPVEHLHKANAFFLFGSNTRRYTGDGAGLKLLDLLKGDVGSV